jgi:glucose-1-phosphatase
MTSRTNQSFAIATSSTKVVVFDLGGVVIRINHTWEDAARFAGISTQWEPDGATPLIGFPLLDAYQKGDLELDDYLVQLAEYAGCTPPEALRIHNGILREEYPGVLELVGDIELAGMITGCLSNTNAAHWEALTSERFPATLRLERKMASHLVGLNKPDPAIFLLYAAQNGFSPEEIVFFDDHPANVEAASEVGFRAFRVDPHKDTASQMREILGLA